MQWFGIMYKEVIFFSASELSPEQVDNHGITSHKHFSVGGIN